MLQEPGGRSASSTAPGDAAGSWCLLPAAVMGLGMDRRSSLAAWNVTIPLSLPNMDSAQSCFPKLRKLSWGAMSEPESWDREVSAVAGETWGGLACQHCLSPWQREHGQHLGTSGMANVILCAN